MQLTTFALLLSSAVAVLATPIPAPRRKFRFRPSSTVLESASVAEAITTTSSGAAESTAIPTGTATESVSLVESSTTPAAPAATTAPVNGIADLGETLTQLIQGLKSL